MEENKARTINMDSNSVKSEVKQTEEKKKLTYEQLNDVCNQLWQQNKQLLIKNRELEQYAVNKRMECLFKVLEFSDKFSANFITDCVEEIQEALTVTSLQDINTNSDTIKIGDTSKGI